MTIKLAYRAAAANVKHVAHTIHEDGKPSEPIADVFLAADCARRFVAAWNACDGIATEALEAHGAGCFAAWAVHKQRADKLQAALSTLRDFELQQSRHMNSETRRDGPQPPNGDDWNSLSMEVAAACAVLPPKRYCVDGSTTLDPRGSVFQGDGKFPPFAIFDIDAQENVELDKRFVYFLSRETAELAMTELMRGAPLDELPADPLHEVPAGYRPLGAHESIAPGVLAISQTDEPDTDNEGEDRITPAGSVWIVCDENGADFQISCYATGASIAPMEAELRDPTQFHLYVRA